MGARPERLPLIRQHHRKAARPRLLRRRNQRHHRRQLAARIPPGMRLMNPNPDTGKDTLHLMTRTPALRRLALSALTGAALLFSQAGAQNATVAVSSIGNTLDAAVANFTNTTVAMDHVYDRIINFDDNFEFTPGVADTWDFTDPLTFTFTIADGFEFHNGEALRPEDVVFSIERLRDVPRLASVMGNITSTEITGDREITITLEEENSTTIRELMAEAHVLNEEYSTSGADWAAEPIGTGP